MKAILFASFFALSLAFTLDCPPINSHPTPSSIKNLHPNDVKVVMAIGDSITAAFGLEGIEGGFDEFRGQSWSIGGDDGAPTIANYLKTFNPSIQGYSIGQHFAELCYDEICPSSHEPKYDKLNGAQSGAYAQNLPDQIQYLYNQVIANPDIDINNDWKVLTILIGANNLCLSCFSDLNIFEAADVYENYMRQTIALTQKLFPRVFINVLEIFNISQVYEIAINYTYCSDLHRGLAFECVCAFDPIDGPANRVKMDQMAQEYNRRLRKIVNDNAVQDDFAVILQPCFSDGKIPGITWLSDLDCFHPSAIGHQGMATALWNNMLVPASQKIDYLDPNAVPACPTNSTLLYTN